MPSEALVNLRTGLVEVEALQRANPRPAEGGGLTKPQVARAIGRAGVVLLSSHLERFVYAVFEEATDYVIAVGPPVLSLPEVFRLQHSRPLIDEMATIHWQKRGNRLSQMASVEAHLWEAGQVVRAIDCSRLLVWMKAPNCKSLVRAFRLWGIEDIFSAITRTPVNRGQMWLRIDDLVSKRNNIAHGDFNAEASYLDVMRYRSVVGTFCERVDRAMARRLQRITGDERPW